MEGQTWAAVCPECENTYVAEDEDQVLCDACHTAVEQDEERHEAEYEARAAELDHITDGLSPGEYERREAHADYPYTGG